MTCTNTITVDRIMLVTTMNNFVLSYFDGHVTGNEDSEVCACRCGVSAGRHSAHDHQPRCHHTRVYGRHNIRSSDHSKSVRLQVDWRLFQSGKFKERKKMILLSI